MDVYQIEQDGMKFELQLDADDAKHYKTAKKVGKAPADKPAGKPAEPIK